MTEARLLKKELKDVTTQLNQCQRDKLDLAARRTKADKQVKELKQQLAELESRCKKQMQGKIAELETELDAAKAESVRRDAELVELKAQLPATIPESNIDSDESVDSFNSNCDELKEFWVSFHKNLGRLEEEAASQHREERQRLYASDQYRCTMVRRLLEKIRREILCEPYFGRDSSIVAHCEEALSHLDEVGVQFREMERERSNE